MNPNDISWKTIDRYFNDNENVIVKHHLDSYNSFFSQGIKEIFKDRRVRKAISYAFSGLTPSLTFPYAIAVISRLT